MLQVRLSLLLGIPAVYVTCIQMLHIVYITLIHSCHLPQLIILCCTTYVCVKCYSMSYCSYTISELGNT